MQSAELAAKVPYLRLVGRTQNQNCHMNPYDIFQTYFIYSTTIVIIVYSYNYIYIYTHTDGDGRTDGRTNKFK